MSMRYGTLPLVHETGGLKDTVFSYNEENGEGNGFSFIPYQAHDMLYTINRALALYREDRRTWYQVVRAAMKCDYSWNVSAEKYVELYRSLLG